MIGPLIRHLLLSHMLFLLIIDPAGICASASDVSFLSETLVRKDQLQHVLEHQPVREVSCEQTPTGPIETTLCDYETIESVNNVLYDQLHELVETPFFKYFRVDLYRECPFWEENVFCMNKDCSIITVDENEIPEQWRAGTLSKLARSEDHRVDLPGCYYRDSDFCFLDDMTEGDYVDLSLNPERFTGYTGVSAHRVWRAIYEENCFGESENSLSKMSRPGVADTMAEILYIDGDIPHEQCLEKKVYYKVISGLHASISTHICHEHLDQTTGQWGPDLQCYVTRIASHPERLQYIYFNTVLLLRAVARLGPYLSAYDYCASGTHEEDAITYNVLEKVLKIAQVAGKFDETVLFKGENANVLKEEFKQHFRNVSRIMDCVGCDKCRLWGKIQTTGLGTAMKVLFELDERNLDPRLNANLLQRSEVVALINTLHRFSESLHAVEIFRRLWRESNAEESAKLIQEAERAVTTPLSRPSSPVNANARPVAGLFGAIQQRLALWVRACKRGTIECVDAVEEALRSIITNLISGSGSGSGSEKDQVPRARGEL
ncbi:endoplasmic oxidoreductin [Multifurca ochricompacta]|uniref:Endoplasmic oxidoreductin n=1 Tax=Multifurca ochricompacta TaxID=376703 RepID=A0AAD4QR16_9AGAM|nr:endoplasmic oxidoreductin [Multifurca ochricompacta]